MGNQQVTRKMDDRGVMTITFNNPEMKNGINWLGLEQLCECFETMISDDRVKVAVLTGNDEYFYTGGRVDPTVAGEQEKYSKAISRFEKLVKRNTKPMIAAISGHCLKAGMGMLMNCDFAIAREGVEFGFPEIRMGGVPMMVMLETMDYMPRKRALEGYLTSWNFSAEDAYMMGLVNRVTSAQEFWPIVEKFVRVFLDTPAHLIEMTRRAYRELSKIHNDDERFAYAMNMLETEVLPAMAETKTDFNV